jgi:hypothetical protein
MSRSRKVAKQSEGYRRSSLDLKKELNSAPGMIRTRDLLRPVPNWLNYPEVKRALVIRMKVSINVTQANRRSLEYR